MLDERTIKTELARLLLSPGCNLTHREGRIRGLFFALTGRDIGVGCSDYPAVDMMCQWLGWECKPFGVNGGYEIDYGDDVDETKLPAEAVQHNES